MGYFSRKRLSYFAKLQSVVIPRHDDSDSINLCAGDKCETVRQLIAIFERGGKNPADYDFSLLDLRGVDLRGLNLRVLGAAALRQINFAGANLSGQDFSRLDLNRIWMPNAILTSANFRGAILRSANLQGAKLGSVNFAGADARAANLNRVVAPGANWEGDFRGAKLAFAIMTYGYFGEASNFEYANMRAADLTGAMTTGEVCFRKAQMQQAVLRGDFRHANFAGADLTAAFMEGGLFDDAVFTGAIMTGVRAQTVWFERVNPINVIDFPPHRAVANRYAALKACDTAPSVPAPRVSPRRLYALAA